MAKGTYTRFVYRVIKEKGCITANEIAKLLGKNSGKISSIIRHVKKMYNVVTIKQGRGYPYLYCTKEEAEKRFGENLNQLIVTRNTVPVTISMVSELLEKLDTYCKLTGTTRSQVIEIALRKFLANVFQETQDHNDEIPGLIEPVR